MDEYKRPKNYAELKAKWQDPDHPKEPYKGFYAECELNGYYYEEWGTVCKVTINGKNLATITRRGQEIRYVTMPELRTWLSKQGYVKAAEL